jgi:hypothetical protein
MATYINEDKEFVICSLNNNYRIYKDGSMFSEISNAFLNPVVNTGYLTADILGKKLRVHRLVAECYVFNDDPTNKTIVNHIDENKLNNHYSNLEWCTHSENSQHFHNNNLIISNKKSIVEINITDGTEIIYKSIEAARKARNLPEDHIHNRLRGNVKNSPYKLADGKFYTWRYAVERITIPRPNNCIQIVDFSNYWITKEGSIYSSRLKNYMKLATHLNGYQCISLRKNNDRITLYVHKLVAQAFLENTDDKPFVNHINGIKSDNRVENLAWSNTKGKHNTPVNDVSKLNPQ